MKAQCRLNASKAGGFHGTHSAESKEKMRLAKIGRPGPWLGVKRGPCSAETKKKMRQAKERSGFVPSQETRELGRRAMLKFRYKDEPRFRSSYEVRVAAALDILGVEWVYEPKKFNCGPFNYIPDFYIVKDDAYWEVKGWFNERSQIKVSAFRRLYPHIPLVVFDKTCLELLEATASKVA